ncbi:hypothetical protein Cgig2_025392 [Carnegiea gigantea]|uniref:Uncharacterized protein n=1 Tax=Carnegiea gigantea TaxID=171969 RepID=A0A9Q1GXV4_9CARY|nr:hypothetical protein Cgig2_025392 [Carnegiea gigantea]
MKLGQDLFHVDHIYCMRFALHEETIGHVPHICVVANSVHNQHSELPPEGVEIFMDVLGVNLNCAQFVREKPMTWTIRRSWHTFLYRQEVIVSHQLNEYHPLEMVCLTTNRDSTVQKVEYALKAHLSLLVAHPQHFLRAPQGGVFVINVDAIIKGIDKNAARMFDEAILHKLSRTPFDGLPSLEGDFDGLYGIVLQRDIGIIALQSKIEGLIKQVCNLKDLEGVHYEVVTTKLKQVESSDGCNHKN